MQARSSSIQVDINRLQRAAVVVDEAVRQGPYPSAVLAVASADRLLLKHSVAKPGQPPAREDAIFLLASITKPIVATAIMRLVEEGRLLLSDPVAKHIPEFASAGKQRVTVYQILTHTSGLSEEEWLREMAGPRRASVADLVRMACRAPVRFEPGCQYEYNSFSFYVLAELIARLGGMPYPEYLRRCIFRPLGMRDTSFAPEGDGRLRAMPVYNVGEPDFGPRLAYYTSVAFPGGGLWSTAADLVAFGQTFARRALRRLPPALAGGDRGDDAPAHRRHDRDRRWAASTRALWAGVGQARPRTAGFHAGVPARRGHRHAAAGRPGVGSGVRVPDQPVGYRGHRAGAGGQRRLRRAQACVMSANRRTTNDQRRLHKGSICAFMHSS